MIKPQQAPVRPRVVSPVSGESVSLEDVVREHLGAHRPGIIEICGGPRTGKTTALAHLATLDCADQLLLLDDAQAAQVRRAGQSRLIIYACLQPLQLTHLAFVMAPWCDDDLIEYLLAQHPQRCAAVLSRAAAPRARKLLGGAPLLCRCVADALAREDGLLDAEAALWQVLGDLAGSREMLQEAGWQAAVALLASRQAAAEHEGAMYRRGAQRDLLDLLHYPSVQRLVAARWLLERLRHGDPLLFEIRSLTADLVAELAEQARSVAGMDQLLRVRTGCSQQEEPLVASVLARLDPTWRPAPHAILRAAVFPAVEWPNAQLAWVRLDHADLSGAVLSDANLKRAQLSDAKLDRTRLHGACLRAVNASDASFRGATLCRANLRRGRFSGADFTDARLDRATASGGTFLNATLTRSCWRGAKARHADFFCARLSEVNFAEADLRNANFRRQDLRTCELEGADLSGAKLAYANLEYITMPGGQFCNAELTGALLTGTTIHGGDFRGASLCSAGLADIDWERADLRSADLRGSSFHLGSTRSGLVGSPYPSHGTRTGFYTNDFDDQSFRAPEEIRKANLCGADLRGANVAGVDFYLVDLRGAQYDSEQLEHFRRCQAILTADRV